MAKRFINGGETADLTPWENSFTSGTYSVGVDATAPRRGVYDIKASRTAAPSGTGCYVGVTGANSTGGGVHSQLVTGVTGGRQYIEASGGAGNVQEHWERYYIRFTTLPTNAGLGIALARYFGSTAGQVVSHGLYGASGNSLRIRGSGGEVTLMTVAAGATWYRVSTHFWVDSAAQGWVFVVYYEENTNIWVASAFTKWDTANGLSTARFGLIPIVTQGTGAIEVHFDDFSIGDEQGQINNGYIGPGSVTKRILNGDGTPADMVPTPAGTHWTTVEEWPPNTADWLRTPTVTTAVDENLDMEDYAGSGVVTAVQVMTYERDTVAGELGVGHRFGLVDSAGNLLSSSNIPVNNPGDPHYWGVCIQGTGSGGDTPWTNAEFNNASCEVAINRVANIGGLTQRKDFFAFVLEVEDNDNLRLASLVVPPFGPRANANYRR